MTTKATRRSFLAGIAAASVTPMTRRRAFGQTPQRGGLLRMGLAGSVEQTLNPALVTDAVNQNINFQTHNTLVEVLPDLTLAPELAESWDVSSDAKVWTLKLRKGVEFHNGKPFEAEDVAYSLDYHRKPETKSRSAAMARQIDEIVIHDKQTISLHLQTGNADFLAILSDFSFIIFPSETKDFDNAVGTGAYILESFEPGVRALTRKNENYWRTDRAFFDGVETLTINDVSARVSALVSGRVDHINRLDLQTAKLLERNPKVNLLNVEGLKFQTIPMMADRDPFNSHDAQLAMKYGINRQAFVDTILSGFGRVGNDHPISPLNRYYNADLPQRGYDPDKAKFHMRKAGLLDHKFQLHVAETGFDGMVDAMALFQQDLKKAGIVIDLVREPIDGYWSNVYMKVPFFTSYYSGKPSEDMILTMEFFGSSNLNETKWNNDHFNKLVEEARGEINQTRRREMYYECQQIVSDEAGVIIPVWINHLMAAAPHLSTPERISGANENDGHRCAERWWFS